MHGRFSGRTALVTGGASGIGFAVAERLLREGAKVATLDLTEAGPEGALPLVGDDEWRRVMAINVDISGGRAVY